MIRPGLDWLAAFGAALFVGSVAAQPAGKAPGAMPAQVAPVTRGTVSSDITAVGNLVANESVVIRPEIAGRVTGLHFTEGQMVQKGVRLVSLDAAELKAQLDGTSADATLNRQRYERAEELFKKNFISSQALDEARNNLSKSNARLLEDRARLARTEIQAPFSGIVGLRLISTGAYLKAGEDVVRIDAISPIKLDFRVPETYLSRIRRDLPVALRVDAYPNDQFSGRIYAVETSVDEKTRTVMLRALVQNPQSRLRPGMFARVTLSVGERTDALLVPEQALIPRGANLYVMRVVDGKAALSAVETGSRSRGAVEIVKGLAAGDVVVTDGHQRLQDGAPVSVMAANPSAPAAPPTMK